MKKLFAFLTAAMLLSACAGTNKNEENGGFLSSGTTDFKGTMVVTFRGEDVSTPDVVISVNYKKDAGKADILFNKVKFVPQMPVTLDITIPGVTVKKEGSTYTFTGNEIEPTVGGVPYAEYKVTGLNGEVKSGFMQLQLNFGSFPTRFLGSQIE